MAAWTLNQGAVFAAIEKTTSHVCRRSPRHAHGPRAGITEDAGAFVAASNASPWTGRVAASMIGVALLILPAAVEILAAMVANCVAFPW